MRQKKYISRASAGFTLLETLMVVGITVILLSVAFVGVIQARITMRQLEMDGTAKEIYFAAQNHLTAAYNQGLVSQLSVSNKGACDPGDNGYYHFIHETSASIPSLNALGLMLPLGSIDETVRMGGNYVIRYHPESGSVLDVFYYNENGEDDAFTTDDDYTNLINNYRGESKKEERKNFNGKIIGYYNADMAAKEEPAEIKSPSLKIENGDVLKAVVTNPNSNLGSNLRLVLLVEGLTSKAKAAVPLDGTLPEPTFTLDDVARSSADYRFYKKMNNSTYLSTTETFIPGENITIRVEASAKNTFSDIKRSIKYTTNSLYANGSGPNGSTKEYNARITSFRHLINLDANVSHFDDLKLKSSNLTENLKIKATQESNLDWSKFCDPNKHDADWPLNNNDTKPSTLSPINPSHMTSETVTIEPVPITYDGNDKKITNVRVAETDSGAGLFGTLVDGSSASNLELVNFSVTSEQGSAGALAASAVGTTISNILVHEDATDANKPSDLIIKGSNAGGLVGTLENGATKEAKVTSCAAAVFVQGTDSAGGLIGKASGANTTHATITNSYSGGHTDDGKYSDTKYNVTASAGSAGGLVGSATNANVTDCYSTCSAGGTTAAGGLLGTASNATATNCYATGLVGPAPDVDKSKLGDLKLGGLIGTATDVTLSQNRYCSIVNEGTENFDGIGGEQADSDKTVFAFDANTGVYNDFAKGDSKKSDAKPYDSKMGNHYSKDDTGTVHYYPYQTIKVLASLVDDTPDWIRTHYGDWASYETLVVNEKSEG